MINTWKINNRLKIKNYHIFNIIHIFNIFNLYAWAMSQKLPVNNFQWIKDTSQFNEDFIKNYKAKYTLS